MLCDVLIVRSGVVSCQSNYRRHDGPLWQLLRLYRHLTHSERISHAISSNATVNTPMKVGVQTTRRSKLQESYALLTCGSLNDEMVSVEEALRDAGLGHRSRGCKPSTVSYVGVRSCVQDIVDASTQFQHLVSIALRP